MVRDTFTVTIDDPENDGGEISLDVKFIFHVGTDPHDDPAEVEILEARKTGSGEWFDFEPHYDLIAEKIRHRIY